MHAHMCAGMLTYHWYAGVLENHASKYISKYLWLSVVLSCAKITSDEPNVREDLV